MDLDTQAVTVWRMQMRNRRQLQQPITIRIQEITSGFSPSLTLRPGFYFVKPLKYFISICVSSLCTSKKPGHLREPGNFTIACQLYVPEIPG